jgi:biopolymer transport protein ExbB
MMASGVASATFPTMTGMAVAVVALLFNGRLQQWSEKERKALQNLKLVLLRSR